jgi:hypothetical protein
VLGWIRRLANAPDQPEPTDSEEALERTRRERKAAEERRPVIRGVMAPIHRALEENHFAERIEAAYAARRGAPQ